MKVTPTPFVGMNERLEMRINRLVPVVVALIVASSSSVASVNFDNFEIVMSIGMTRAAVVELLGAPDAERCGTVVVQRCAASWSTVLPPREFKVMFVFGRVVAWQACQRASIFSGAWRDH